jgi:hypothetical protein
MFALRSLCSVAPWAFRASRAEAFLLESIEPRYFRKAGESLQRMHPPDLGLTIEYTVSILTEEAGRALGG